jgi:hypothetical protein
MPDKPNPRYKPLPGNQVQLRSQVRFKMATESVALAKEYRAKGYAQVLSDTNLEHVISFPSAVESLWVVEIVHHGEIGRPLYAAHESAVTAFYTSFVESHPPAEIVAEKDLENAPGRDKWVKISG